MPFGIPQTYQERTQRHKRIYGTFIVPPRRRKKRTLRNIGKGKMVQPELARGRITPTPEEKAQIPISKIPTSVREIAEAKRGKEIRGFSPLWKLSRHRREI